MRVPGAARHEMVRRRPGTATKFECDTVPDLRCTAISAFMRVFDALWRCTASGTRTKRTPHRLNNPMISAFASVLKCKLKPTTAADVSAFTSSLSAFTANTVNR